MESFQSHKLCWIIVYFVLRKLSLAYGTLPFISREYTRDGSCKLQERIDNGCAELQEGNYESLIACSAMCRSGCTGVVWEGNSRCYLYKPCQNSIDCTQAEFDFYRKMNPCQHNGTWDVTTDSCKCVDDWVGERCERLPVNCRELREFGYPTGYSNRHWVKLDLNTYHEPVRVLCEVFDNYENIVVMYNRGNFDNRRSWTEYVNGYYNDDGNFWLGLDKIKALNNAGSTFLVLSVGFNDQNKNFTAIQRAFYNFSLNGPSFGYSFNFEGGKVFGSGPNKDLPYGDCLRPLVGAKFSTWDHDNDQDNTHNCATQANVGWWFKDCDMVCNPLGWNYHKLKGPETKQHVKMTGVNLQPPNVIAETILTYMYFHSKEE